MIQLWEHGYRRQALVDAQLPRFKAAALARAKEFDISRVMPKYEEYYREVIALNYKKLSV